MKKLLIRADDLGWTEAINYGIEKTVRHGIIRSVGVMPNMKAAEHGLNLLKGTGVCLGQHTNICVGRPICDPERVPSITTEDGNFKSSAAYRDAMKLGKDIVNLDEVILEIEAQYHRFRELTGEEPHYFEGHAVASPNLMKGLRIVAEKYHLPLLELNMNSPVKFGNGNLQMCMDSMNPDYDPFESLRKAVERSYEENTWPMFVCHPGYLDAELMRSSSFTIPRIMEVEMLTSESAVQLLQQYDVKLISYDDLMC